MLTNIKLGQQELTVDGRVAGSGAAFEYGYFVIGVKVEADKENLVPPIYLPKIKSKDWIDIPSPVPDDTIVRNPDVPGMEIHIPKGAILRDRDGKVVTKVALTPMPLDRSPFPFPENAPVYVSVQPGGMVVQGLARNVTPGIRVIYPNQTDAKVGERVSFWAYSSSDAGWQIYGEGQVTGDSKQVVPDANVALYESVGFMYTISNPPPPDPEPPAGGDGGGGPDGPDGPNGPDGPDNSDDPNDNSGGGGGSPCDVGTAGDPVDCKTGLFVLSRPDIRVKGLIPINVTRVYRPGDTTIRAFGLGTTHGYAAYLREVSGTLVNGVPTRYQQYDLIRPDGSTVRFVRNIPGGTYTDLVSEHTSSASDYFKARLAYESGNYVITKKNGVKYAYSLYGTLQFIQDPSGNRLEVTRNGGQISRITTSSGRYVDMLYDASSRITQIKDIAGRTWNYSYSTAGFLAQATYPDGVSENYTYDASGRMLTLQNRIGLKVVINEYDAGGRVSKQTLADGGVFLFAYTLDTNSKVTQTDVTDPRNNIRRVTYESHGYKATETYALGTASAQTTTYERNAAGLLTALIDPLGRRTEYARDVFGNIIKTTRLAGTANANIVSSSYTADYNKLATRTDPRGKITILTYDNVGRVTQVKDPLNHITIYTYDGTGNVLTAKNALNHTVTFSYDLSDLRTVTDPLNRVTTVFTDAIGRIISVNDPLNRFSKMEYDVMGRIVKTTDPLGQISAMTYNSNGKRLTFTDPRNQTITWAYDPKSRAISRKDALSQTETTTYDKNGNVTAFTDRRNLTRTISYDALDRSSVTTYANASTVSNIYDAADRVTQMVDSVSGTISHVNDGLDRLTQQTTPQGVATYTYDAAHRRTSMTITGQPTVTYAYDDANRFTSISQNAKVTAFTYDNANRMTKMTMPNGVEKNYTYDNASQVTAIIYKKGTTTIGDLAYAFDNAGQITQITGSLSRTALPPATTANAVYDANNRLTSWNGQAITYDAQGNMQSFASSTYQWDVRNRLTAITGTSPASFQNGPMGRRISKTAPITNNIATQLTYDSGNPVVEKQGTTTTGTNLTSLGIDSYLTRQDGIAETYPLTDHLGSTIALTDATGAIVTNYTYEPYGATTSTGTVSSNPHQYTGRENDGTGLYYYRARYYNPQLGRFISEDPIGLAGGINQYQYAQANPIAFTDPSGLKYDVPEKPSYPYNVPSSPWTKCPSKPPVDICTPNKGTGNNNDTNAAILGNSMAGGGLIGAGAGGVVGAGFGLAEAAHAGAVGGALVADGAAMGGLAGGVLGAGAGAVVGLGVIGGLAIVRELNKCP